jgi:hypothetical protein
VSGSDTHRYRLVELDYANSIAYEDGDPLGLSDMVSSESREVLWVREMTADEAADYAENPDDLDRLEPPNYGDLLQGETAYRLEVYRDGKWVYAHGVTVPSEDEAGLGYSVSGSDPCASALWE